VVAASLQLSTQPLILLETLYMGQIALEGMAFYAHHGYYTEERKRGNNYEVDVEVSYDMEPAAVADDLGNALNYEKVYAICRQEMEIPRHLIETVARSIAIKIREAFPNLDNVRVKVRKHSPELGGPVRNASVVYVL
jgi:dihydroneopterin aldolase